MNQSKTNELIGSSDQSFEDALAEILRRANQTLRGIKMMTVIDKKMSIDDKGACRYHLRAHMQFDMTAPDNLHL